jgi:hypothetical protein
MGGDRPGAGRRERLTPGPSPPSAGERIPTRGSAGFVSRRATRPLAPDRRPSAISTPLARCDASLRFARRRPPHAAPAGETASGLACQRLAPRRVRLVSSAPGPCGARSAVRAAPARPARRASTITHKPSPMDSPEGLVRIDVAPRRVRLVSSAPGSFGAGARVFSRPLDHRGRRPETPSPQHATPSPAGCSCDVVNIAEHAFPKVHPTPPRAGPSMSRFPRPLDPLTPQPLSLIIVARAVWIRIFLAESAAALRRGPPP